MSDPELTRQARKSRLLQFYRAQEGGDNGSDLQNLENIFDRYSEISGESVSRSSDPCDIDGSAFQAPVYLTHLLKEKNLSELMEKEKEMIEKIRSLDSEMQTLVYDNYNKFITATDTIRMMKTDFKKMEEEMNLLAENMGEITKFSVGIRSALHPKRDEINKLARTHQLLRKLQYLFELPQRLRICVSSQQYLQAVRCYNKARAVLDRYQEMPSFHGIRDDCRHIMAELKQLLWKQFAETTEIQELGALVDILRQLGEPIERLAEEFINHSQAALVKAFENLRHELHPTLNDSNDAEHSLNPFPPDVLHFANIATDTVLDKLSNHVSVYNELFLSPGCTEPTENEALQTLLVTYLNNIMPEFFKILYDRMEMEKESGDNAMFVRAMDRFHARLQALNKLVPRADFGQRGLEMVCALGRERSQHYLAGLKRHFNDCLTDVRQRLASGAGVGGGLVMGSRLLMAGAAAGSSITSGGQAVPSPPPGGKIQGEEKRGSTSLLQELQQTTSLALVEQMKATLNAQQSFIAMDNTFSKKPLFQEQFCARDVREGIVVGFLHHMTSTCRQLAEEQQTGGGASSAPTLLILSRLCFDWANGDTVEYLVTLADEQFLLATFENTYQLTRPATLIDEFLDCGQMLLNAFVRVQGLSVSQMIRKSVETRDWLNSIEPRAARSVMKRVIEDITQIDQQVGQLFELKVRGGRDRSSDSSRRTGGGLTGGAGGGASMGLTGGKTAGSKRSQWSLTPSTLDNTIITNIQKLFAEKIDIFAGVEPSRESILTGVVKIGLKTFMECVRLRTFGKYGLQQVQVDCRYLQIYLWRFVTDENLVNFLLDEVISSALQRCVEPTLMDGSVKVMQAPAAKDPKPDNEVLSLSTRLARIENYRWLLRPCPHYQDEYKDCKTLYNRFNWYYVHGETPDCSQWLTDFQNCSKYEQQKSDESLVEVIESEKRRRFLRLKSQANNDVWKYRESPPEEWTKTLPDHLCSTEDARVLQEYMDKEKDSQSMCSIM